MRSASRGVGYGQWQAVKPEYGEFAPVYYCKGCGAPWLIPPQEITPDGFVRRVHHCSVCGMREHIRLSGWEYRRANG